MIEKMINNTLCEREKKGYGNTQVRERFRKSKRKQKTSEKKKIEPQFLAF